MVERRVKTHKREEAEALDSRYRLSTGKVIDEVKWLVSLHSALAAQYQDQKEALEHSACRKVFGDFTVAHYRSIELLAGVLNRLKADQPADIATVVSMHAHDDAGILRVIQERENQLKQEYIRNLALLSETAGLEATLKVNKGETTKRLGWLEGELNMLDHTSH